MGFIENSASRDPNLAELEQGLIPSSYLPLSSLRGGDVLELFPDGSFAKDGADPEFRFDVSDLQHRWISFPDGSQTTRM